MKFSSFFEQIANVKIFFTNNFNCGLFIISLEHFIKLYNNREKLLLWISDICGYYYILATNLH